MTLMGFPSSSGGKESVCLCRRYKRWGFHPWVGKIPWRRPWQPTPVFLPGESHGQRSLVYTTWGFKESDSTECAPTHTHSTHTQVKCQVLASQLNEKHGFYILTKKMKPWRKSFPHLQCRSVDCGSDSISCIITSFAELPIGVKIGKGPQNCPCWT